MSRTAAIILGHSHLSAVVNHLVQRPSSFPADNEAIEYYIFDTVRLGANFEFSPLNKDGVPVLNPAIDEMILNKIPQDRNKIFISMFGGNAHNALSLLEHPRKFDFVLPGEENLPFEKEAEVVPTDYIANFITRMASVYIMNAETLRNYTSDPVYHFESPPPIGDDEFVQSHLEQYFLDQTKGDVPRLSPRWLRYKLWRLHSKIIQGASESRNICFVSCPEDTKDKEGFLTRECYGTDSTHAGPKFAELLLDKFEGELELKYGGWSWLY